MTLTIEVTDLSDERPTQTTQPDQPQPQPQSQPRQEHEVDDDESNDESSDLLNQIWNAERECRHFEAEVEFRKEEVKEAKAQLEQAVIRLRELCSRQKDCRDQGRSCSRKQKTVETNGKPATPPKQEPGPVGENSSAVADLSWRDSPIAELFAQPIKGLGKKKKEALADMCQTMGAFEDLRGQASKDHKSLHEVLPDGFGIETASALEENFLDWLAARSPGSSKNPILVRAERLNNGSDNCLDHKHTEGDQWHKSGWEAFGREVSLEECPYTPGPEQDDWIRGWLGHKVIASYDGSESEDAGENCGDGESAEQLQQSSESPPFDLAASLDDL